MGYYDNVKDSIRDENSEKDGDSDSGSKASDSGKSGGMGAGNFDTLREAAEETEVEDDEGGDDTPIEVLEEDGLRKETSSGKTAQGQKQEVKGRGKASQESSGGQRKEKGNIEQKSSQSRSQGSRPENSVSGDTSELEDKMDKIIEQNARMIEILEGFGN